MDEMEKHHSNIRGSLASVQASVNAMNQNLAKLELLHSQAKAMPEDPSEFHQAAHDRTFNRLEDLVPRVEALEAALRAQGLLPVQSPTTASSTTAVPLDVLGAPMPVATLASSHPLGVPTGADLTHVAQCSECQVRAAYWSGSYRTLVPDADGRSWIFPSQESPSSAVPAQDDVPSASSASSKRCTCEDRYTYVVPDPACPVHAKQVEEVEE